MKFYATIFVIFNLPLGIILEENQEESEDIKIMQFVANYGYPIETHEVETEDGYILRLFRIPHGRTHLTNIQNNHPVLLSHAMVVSSEIYVLLGPKRSLGFVLADNGYDVWLMNSRGAWHSRRHKKLNTKQKQFWKFSWNEMGVYDIPAVIDYILRVTLKPDLQYIGHSQGTTALLVMGSERPEYNSKIKVMIALAPGAKYKHVQNGIYRMIAPHYRLLEALADYFGIYELPPPFLSDKKLRRLLKILCLQSDHLSLICKVIIEIHSSIFNMIDLQTVLSGAPCSFSVIQVLHYAQLMTIDNFQQYNWGPKKNLKRYGSKITPQYNIKNISYPVAMFFGESDDFIVEEDIQFLRDELPNIIEEYTVPMKSFTHFDFVVGNNLQKILYDKVLKVMAKFK